MKKLYYLLLLTSCSFFAQVGVNNTDPKSQLDISASSTTTPANTDGILIPRMSAFPASNPGLSQNGMLMFLTTTASGKTPGFYYWDNATTSWVGMSSTSSSSNIEGVNIEDFLFDEYAGASGLQTGAKNDNQYSFTPIIANGGISNIESEVTSNNYAGIHKLSTGTTSNNTGRAAIGSSDWYNKYRLGNNEYAFEFRVRFPVLAVAAGVNYLSYFGLTNLTHLNIASTQVTNGVYFTYTSAGIVGTCENTSVVSNTTAFTAVANTWYKLKFIINAAGTSVDFYIDGVKLGSSITTNIPSSTTGLKITGLIEKSSTTTTASVVDLDYVSWKMVR